MKPMKIKDVVKAVNGELLQGNEEDEISSVEVDSRKANKGALFVPFVGEKVDAHKFIKNVIEAGAAATFTIYKEAKREEKGAYILVEDPLDALQKLAAYYRSQFTLPIIGVTGSVGKTTTKEMIASVLEKKYNVLKTEGNLNSQIGVSLMMLRLSEEYDMAVIEMGISEFNEMDRLVEMVKPEMTVMTNVGVSHIGILKTRENICHEKGKIMNSLKPGGHMFICGNGDLIKLSKKVLKLDEMKKEKGILISYYGTENECDYLASDIVTEEGKTTFTYRYSKKEEPITLSVMGIHNVNNALVALAIANEFNVPFDDSKEALRKYQPYKMRGEVKKGNGISVIDDTYNASPDSIKSSIEVLFSLKEQGRKIAVLADVLELGKRSEELHRGIGKYISERAEEGNQLDLVITVGTEAAYISDEIKQISTIHFNKRTDAEKYIMDTLVDGDVYLVKGSRGMAMDQLVLAILNPVSYHI